VRIIKTFQFNKFRKLKIDKNGTGRNDFSIFSKSGDTLLSALEPNRA
jgi:hypothetical protein